MAKDTAQNPLVRNHRRLFLECLRAARLELKETRPDLTQSQRKKAALVRGREMYHQICTETKALRKQQ